MLFIRMDISRQNIYSANLKTKATQTKLSHKISNFSIKEEVCWVVSTRFKLSL
jgi:hypothetical protein